MSNPGQGQGTIPSVSPAEAWNDLTSGAQTPAPALIDVREVDEYQGGHAKGAVNIPLSELQARVDEVPRDREVLLICHSGRRSQQAAMFLRGQGVTRGVNVTGGTEAWEKAGLPLER